MRRIEIDERRARVGLRHCLSTPMADATETARSLVALHSSDPTTVYLSTWARTARFEVPHLEDALYAERSLVRLHGMRRTLWVVARDMVPFVNSSSSMAIARAERRRTARLLEEGGVTDDGALWLDRITPLVVESIRSKGEALTRDITGEIPALREKLELYNQKGRLMGTTGVGSRTMLQLSLESRIVRTRPAGSWVSGQYRWAVAEEWLGGPIPEVPISIASGRLLAGWLATFGPATEADIKWWTGWPLGQVRKALTTCGAVEVELDTGTGYVLAEDVEPVSAPPPWVALLPSLDPTTMGWKERDWYLGRHGATLFDRNGNAGSTIWADGRIVGGWSQRKDGEVVYEILEDVGAETADAIAAKTSRLQAWMGDVSITSRFRSPHDKMLSS